MPSFDKGDEFEVLREAKASEVAKGLKSSRYGSNVKAPKSVAGSDFWWVRWLCDGMGSEELRPKMIRKDAVDWCPFQKFVPRDKGGKGRAKHEGITGVWEDQPRPRVAPQEGAGSKRPAADNPADVPVSKASKAPDQPNVDKKVTAATTAMARIKGAKDVCDMQRGNCPGDGKCAKCATNVCDMLDVPRGSNVQAIKKAWYGLARLLHPDTCRLEGALHVQAQEALQKVNAHYGNAVPKNGLEARK